MNTMAFPTADALVQYVNDNTIPSANVKAIVVKDGQFWLFWFMP